MRKKLWYLRLYKCLMLQEIKNQMSYRADFLVSLLAILLTNAFNITSLYFIFLNIPDIGGYNYMEMLFIYGFYMMSDAPGEFFFVNNWNLDEHIYSGSFIRYCTKPVNQFFYYYSEKFNVNALCQFLIGTAVLTYSILNLGIEFSLWHFLVLLPLLFFSSLVMASIMNTIAALGFWIINSQTILDIIRRLKDFSRYPVTILNTFFRLVFSFVIPLAFVAYYPSTFFIGGGETTIYPFLTPVVGVILFYISYRIWMNGARSYSGTGS